MELTHLRILCLASPLSAMCPQEYVPSSYVIVGVIKRGVLQLQPVGLGRGRLYIAFGTHALVHRVRMIYISAVSVHAHSSSLQQKGKAFGRAMPGAPNSSSDLRYAVCSIARIYFRKGQNKAGSDVFASGSYICAMTAVLLSDRGGA